MREYLLVFLVAAVGDLPAHRVAREIALRTGAVAAGPRPRRARRADPLLRRAGHARAGSSRPTSSRRELPFLVHERAVRLPRRRGGADRRGARSAPSGCSTTSSSSTRSPSSAGRCWPPACWSRRACSSTYFPGAGGAQFSLDARRRAALLTAPRGHRHGERGELRRRPRRAGGGRGRHRARWRSSSSATSWPTSTSSLAITGALLCAALAGACAGFLPHNFYPARLFMGDSGSMLIGLVLSASALTLTGQFVGMPETTGRQRLGRERAAGAAADLCRCRS